MATTGASANVGGDDKIGAYKVVRVILPGQNSTVMEVSQDNTGKRFALKQMLESKASDAAERKAFEFEAKFGQEMTHPNLIRVYEYVKDKHGPYFVMDYFPSEHMRLIINKRDKIEWMRPRLHRIITQVMQALAYMHDKGWVHRDIKPENILVNRTAEVRLIDYALAKKLTTGLAKLLSGKPPREGTHSYIAPEVILRQPPSVSADIYSLGITCYELACGRPPFRANSPMDLLNKHLKEAPMPPLVHEPKITPEFSDLIMRMIKKNPAERPASMQEILSKFRTIRVYKDDPDPQAGATPGFG
jgi:serine/threonine protein kinase